MTAVLIEEAIGLQTPRYGIDPKNIDNTHDADDAIELFSRYSYELDEWQETVLRSWMARRKDGRWASTRCGLSVPRQQGKSLLLEVRCIAGLVLLGEKIVLTAHEMRTAKVLFTRLTNFFENEDYPEIRRLVKSIRKANGQESIILHNGGELAAMTRTNSAGRGLTADLVILDEALRITDESWQSLEATITAGPLQNPQIIFASSPPGPNDLGERFGQLRETVLNEESERYSWYEWSAHEGAEADFDDPEVWAQANPSLNIRLNQDVVVDERLMMDETTFARERLGLYESESKTQMFSDDLWESCRDETVYPLENMVLAIDVKPDRSSGTISVAGIRPDGLSYIEVIDSAQGIGWIIPRVMDICAKQNIKTVVVDYLGPAGTLVEPLRAKKIRVHVTSVSDYQAACAMFYDGVHEHTLIHRGQPLLDYSVRGVTKRKVGDKWLWNRKDASSDITQVVSTSLALFGTISTKVRKSKPTNKSSSKRKAVILR